MNAEFVLLLLAAALCGGVAVYVLHVVPAKAAAARSEAGRTRAEATLEAHLSGASALEGKLDDKLKKLAVEALRENSKDFRERMADFVSPITTSLEKFESRVGKIERDRAGAYAKIEQQVSSLGAETNRLVQALRKPKTRGRWGEFQLQRVLELAGMLEHCDFDVERSLRAGNGYLRPDVIVRLPGDRSIIIDAKTSLDGYLDAVEADTEEGREVALREHARQLGDHVLKLASKAYWNALPGSPDFVVMFVPGEALVDVAGQLDPKLHDRAIREKVLITTPTTLVALLKTVAYGWEQEKVAENAKEVADRARDLYSRIRVFAEHVGKLGDSLGNAIGHFNKSVGSLESRVLPAARRFEKLGVTPGEDEIPLLGRVELAPREVQARDLVSDRHGPRPKQ